MKDRALFDDECGRIDVAVDLAVAMNFYALVGDDLSDHRSADGDAADVDFSFDVCRLADDQLIFRADATVELAVDAHRVVELELSLE